MNAVALATTQLLLSGEARHVEIKGGLHLTHYALAERGTRHTLILARFHADVSEDEIGSARAAVARAAGLSIEAVQVIPHPEGPYHAAHLKWTT